MDKEKNLEELVRVLSEENEQLKKEIIVLNERLSYFSEDEVRQAMHAKEFSKAIADAKAAKENYEEATKEIIIMKTKYQKEINDLIDNIGI